MKNVLLLGASGSIGSQTLDILEKDPSSFRLISFSVGHQISKIPAILSRFPSVKSICVLEKGDIEPLKRRYPNIDFHCGDEGVLELISEKAVNMVVNAIVGFAGLFPTLKALELDKTLCLANKESLVVGGRFVNDLLEKGRGTLYPIDSEHVAIAKCLSKVDRSDVKRLILTGSGGAFRSLPLSALKDVTPEMALKHPTWKMGARITIDCATMMNKGFEVIEAKELFGFPFSQISIVLHDESQVHSLIELKDGTYLADIGAPDMHGPIEYALREGKNDFEVVSFRSFEELEGLHFHEFDPKRYPAVPLALKAASLPLGATCVLNAADEEAVRLFLEKKISFLDIGKIVAESIEKIEMEVKKPDDLKRLDNLAREFVKGGEWR